jgi:astacin
VTVQLPGGAERQLDVSLIENRAVFEGDIVLTRGLETLGVVHSNIGRRWPARTVIYDIAPTLPNPQRVVDAVAHWQNHTVIKFQKRQTEKDYVFFRSGGSCSSAVGKIGGVQFVTLSSSCSTGNVIHEIGHAVGLWHEQSREDRDSKVTIRWENISEAAAHNFNQQIQDGDDVGNYDYGSIMHYPANAFSKNGMPTIVPTEANVVIGQRDGLSPGDIATVAKMYENI